MRFQNTVCRSLLFFACSCQYLLPVAARVAKHPKLAVSPTERSKEGSYIVTMKKGQTVTSAIPFAQDNLKYTFEVVLQDTVLLRDIDDDMLMKILENEEVLEVREDYLRVRENPLRSDAVVQQDPVWGLDRIDQRNLPLNMEYNYEFDGTGVTIFIFEGGVLPTHEEYADRYVGCTDFTGEGCGAYSHYHATHVAATALGSTYGVAKGASVWDIVFFDSNDDFIFGASLMAYDFVAQKKRDNPDEKYVINGSYGGPFDEMENEVVAACAATGVVVVLAAGNEFSDACDRSPGSTPEAITVGATNIADEKADFSNFGSCVDIFAPGVDVLSASNETDADTAILSGTSMATPHVAGIAALMLEEGLDPNEQLLNDATLGVISGAGAGSPNLLAFNGFNEDPILTAHPTPAPTTAHPTLAPTPVPTVSCPDGEALFLLELLTDAFPSETNVTLTNDCNGELILDGGPESDQQFELIFAQACILDDNRYTFTIFDSYGDGICCNYGDGSYEIFKDGVSLGGGGDFEDEESTTFGACLSMGPLNPTPVKFGNIPVFSALAGEIYFFVYNIDGMKVLPDDQVTCTTSGLNGDASLGVRLEQFGDFDCVSDNAGSSNEECIVLAPSGTIDNVYVQVAAGSEDFNDLILECEFGTTPTIPPPTMKPTLPYISAPGSS